MIDNAVQGMRKRQEARGKGLLRFSDHIGTMCNNMVEECVAIDREGIETLHKKERKSVKESLGNEFDCSNEHYI